ncbi:MAG: IgGFc-binding protein [Myxococcales bacterium]|nr:IgGFc-binding protein [Myxococcales bacterium]
MSRPLAPFLAALLLVPLSCNGGSGSNPFDSASGTGDATTAHDATGATSSPPPTSGPSPSTGDVVDDTSGGGPIFDLPDGDTDGPNPGSCLDVADVGTTVGCQFYAVDLDQAQVFENQQFAVAVSNVNVALSAEVIVEEKQGGAWVTVDGPVSVGALDLHVFPLPNKVQLGTGLSVGGSYRISSDVPIVAYQFNPLTMGWWSSDASMLFPSVAWDTLSHVVGWGPGTGKAYATVVAAEDATHVEVRPSVDTVGGPGIPPGLAGGVFSFDLDEGDVAQIAVSAENASLVGTRIEADKPIGVFTGHECAFVPGDLYACDHLEEQVAGLRLWGTRFAASRVPPRHPAAPEDSLWQIQASEDDTTITFDAPIPVTGLPAGPQVLDAGEVLEIFVGGPPAAPGDFYVEADKPIAVLDYMTGWEHLGEQIGDPAMLQLSPIEQFLDRYVVLVPNQWSWDYLVITRPQGVGIELDGTPIDDSAFVASANGWEVARVLAEDGVHQLRGDEPFSVAVVGYDLADSYAYMGGSGTGLINPEPAG